MAKTSHPPIAFQKLDLWSGCLAALCAPGRTVLVGNKGGLPVRRGRETVEAPYHEKLAVEESAWRFYRRFFSRHALQPLEYEGGGLRLDYAVLIEKGLSNELISYAGLRRAARRLGLRKPVYLGRFFRPRERRAPVARALYQVCAWLLELQGALGSLGLQLARVAAALCSRSRPSRADVLWMGIGPNEEGRLGEQRSFYWPERAGSRLSHLYLLPRTPRGELRRVLRDEPVSWTTQLRILSVCSKARLLRLLARLLATAIALPLPWRGSWILKARLCGMHFEALSWDEFARATGVKAAFTTPSNWTSLKPVLVALQNAGAKTAVWHYSANVIPVNHAGERPSANGRWRTVHEAGRIYVWNQQVAEWHRRNLCDSPRNRIIVSGPVMCGDARLCRRRAPDRRLQISIFDITMAAGKKKRQFGSPHIPEEYFPRFWRDILRLAREVPEAVFLIKPKKSARGGNRSFPDAYFDLVQDAELLGAGRLKPLGEDADPYRAIADCDLAIGMPFTSPILASWHFGRAGAYYDPTGRISFAPYEALGRFNCRDFDALRSMALECAQAKSKGAGIELPAGAERLIGNEAMQDPQEFLLSDLATWIGAAPARERTVAGARAVEVAA